MPVSDRQLAEFADSHAWDILFDTSPRHLAGPGDGRHVTHGLAASGWTRTSDPLSPEMVLRSPDHRYDLQFDAQYPTSARWRLRAKRTDIRPGWYAEFGALIPAEVLGAVTDALVAPAAAQRRDPLDAATAAGWLRDTQDTATSPDAACRIERGLPYDEDVEAMSWHMRACEPGQTLGKLWHAAFDAHTPLHLVDAFVAALADPTPLQRSTFDRTAHGAVLETSRLSGQHVVNAHTARVRALAAQTGTARRQTATPPRPSSSPNTSPRR